LRRSRRSCQRVARRWSIRWSPSAVS